MKDTFANIKYNLTHDWSAIRILRVMLATIAFWQWYAMGDILMGLAGLFLAYQVIMNVSCAGGNCYTPTMKNKTSEQDQTLKFEEIK